jgi:F-type H+-transporting ATPase subunit delta
MNTDDIQDLHPFADVASQRVARVYAEALLNAAEKHGQGDEVVGELDSLVRDLFRADPEFEAFLSSAAVSRDRKAQVLDAAFAHRASEVLANFLQVLNNHDRLELLRPILAEARELSNRRHGRVRVRVRSAVALPDDQRERLVQELRQVINREPLLETQVDPDLLGGLVVRVGDWLYDASVRTQIDTIRSELIARGSHEIQSGRDRFSAAGGD